MEITFNRDLYILRANNNGRNLDVPFRSRCMIMNVKDVHYEGGMEKLKEAISKKKVSHCIFINLKMTTLLESMLAQSTWTMTQIYAGISRPTIRQSLTNSPIPNSLPISFHLILMEKNQAWL